MKEFFKPVYLLILVIVVLFIAAISFLPKRLPQKTVSPPKSEVLPTKTPEEIKVIGSVQTKTINLTLAGPKPKDLTIRPNDQVKFVNQTDKILTVVGEGWGNVPLEPNEPMLQPFKEPGRFLYRLPALGEHVSGEIVVK